MWLLGILCVSLRVGWTTVRLDHVTATSVLRLWHQLYTAHLQSHDFEELLGVSRDVVYSAVVSRDEIRAVACLASSNESQPRLFKIAHAPNCTVAADVLVETLVVDERVLVDWKRIKAQPIWMIACCFHASGGPEQLRGSPCGPASH